MTAESRSVRDYWVNHPVGYVGSYEFGPDGTVFDCEPPPSVCIFWVDEDDDGRLDRPPYQYRIPERGLRARWTGSSGPITPRCVDIPCGGIGADGLPSDWGDPSENNRTDDSSLRACCDMPSNRLCFQIDHFSSYGVTAEPGDCAGEIGAAKLKVLKLDQGEGRQKLVLSGRVVLPAGTGTVSPEPDITPLVDGFQVVIRDNQGSVVWSAEIPPGEFDKAAQTGWKANRGDTVFKFTGHDRSDGVSKVIVKKIYSKMPGAVSVKLVARGASVSVDPLHLPLQAEVSFLPGDENRCGVTSFDIPPARPFCAPNRSATAILCR
ncbi:MAG: hypothetical protein ABGY42_16940 [bacterium]